MVITQLFQGLLYFKVLDFKACDSLFSVDARIGTIQRIRDSVAPMFHTGRSRSLAPSRLPEVSGRSGASPRQSP